jgi:hypothetical protein
VSTNEVPTCAPFQATNLKYIDKTGTLKEVKGVGKSGDTSIIKIQEFNLLKSDFNTGVDLKATFTTHKTTIGNQITSVKTTALFSMLYNNVELTDPIASWYKYFTFKVTDIFGRTYYYDFNGRTACKVDLPLRTAWGLQIKDVELIGGNA